MTQKSKPQTVAALEAFIKLKRSAESVSTRVHSVLGDYALTESQFGILEAIHHLGPLCQRDLAGKILRTTANITLTIDKLEKKGLVTRARDLTDRRYYSIHLTEAGEQLINEAFPRVRAGIIEAMSVLSTTELEELSRLCKTLGTSNK